MAKIKAVEKRMWDVEGFDVVFCQNGKDVRGDRQGIPQYPYVRAAKDHMTVSDWRDARFLPNYPGFNVEVLDGDGNHAHGLMKLENVRDSYESES
jgi:hypothetical protein